MTWAFGYLVCIIVGLVLASVTGLIRDLRALAHHGVVVPHSDLHRPFLGFVAGRLGAGLILLGVVGLALSARRGAEPRSALGWACVAGGVAATAAMLLLRRRLVPDVGRGRAVVVKEIQPGGYGQVRLERDGVTVLLAAQSADPSPIPAGSEVEVVECTRSVLIVRRPGRG